MFKFFRRRTDQADVVGDEVDVTADARERAEEFWRRWDELLPEVAAALGEGMPQRVDHDLAEAVAALHPDLTFSVEQGERAVYALVVSGQANPEVRPYTDAWLAAAPQRNALFEYHDSVPPVPDPTQVTVNLRGESYPLADVRVFAQVDAAEGLVDVSVYHPRFAGMESAAQSALTFLPLDATLGERLAADRLGRVETAEQEPRGAMGLLEFRELVRGFDAAGGADSAESGGTGGGAGDAAGSAEVLDAAGSVGAGDSDGRDAPGTADSAPGSDGASGRDDWSGSASHDSE
ncbi:hypothetical protein GCM10027271_26330 [Saccharopolyspora gloriosae]|uniref:Uncharacterized protein n=1 Tax=Saccharopolyspora gloriosae TaxID=455344 RepID=A0A840NTM1_9PSEU|nr:hypothetical protein [Saccharopolyspora gloriosae]